MPAFQIPNFRFGLDRRRPRVAGAVGTLWNIENAHISRGGDVERSKSFVPTYTLPAGAFGLAAVGSRLFVFGSSDLAATIPAGLNFQRLIAPSSPNMTGVLTAVAYNGAPYVIASYDDGNIYHFYNGARVTDWDGIADTNSSISSLTDYLALLTNANPEVVATAYGSTILITSQTAGVADTITAAAVNGGSANDQTATVSILQAAVTAVSETLAQGSFTATGGSASPGANQVVQIFAGATPLMAAAVDWVSSNSATANAVAAQINNLSQTSGYTAASVGAVVTISAAPGTGATPNGTAVSATVAGDATYSAVALAGGVTKVLPVAQIAKVVIGGTFEPLDQFTLTVNGVAAVTTGRASGTGLTAYVFLTRIYSCANTHLQYCAINAPTDWTTALGSSGAGFINLSSQAAGAERLTGCDAYGVYTAIFSARSVKLYNLTADATQASLFQQIKNTGNLAALSLQSFANTDLFYLGTSGVRSLKVKDTTFAAYSQDAGAAIDQHVQAWMKAQGPGVYGPSVSVIEPLDQRYWLAVGARIYVYSYFPATQIAAWSYYSPGFAVSAFATIDDRLYCLSGATIYLYGGQSGQVYPIAGETPVTFETPFLTTGAPEESKLWTSLNIAAQGTWGISYLVNPNDETQVINGGLIVNSTYTGPSANLAGRSPMFALRATCSSAGYATFSEYSASFLERNSRS